METNKIYLGDSLNLIPELSDNSIDLVLTDPPYNISSKNNFHTMGRAGIDFGKWDDGSFDQKEWIKLVVPKIKKGGSIVIFNSYSNMGIMEDILTECGMTPKNMLIWHKTNPMPRNRDRLYVRRSEFALWAVKDKGWCFNRQKDTYEDGIFTYSAPHHNIRIHPTQKPIPLLEELLRIHSNKGDLVLDPFSGSGSTAEACKINDRKFIAFEKEEDFYKKSLIRVGL